ncbi:amino acid adenylation domain-containing protein [Clostridium tagluense]|uniref:non-ribosomal peptide synthetase n=1 Tax=Clostridium tagluense TaxID=360422 RepID=UPI001CF1B4ED|nr:non-ribosomal peptide synthetase [Clostridium tagluense]MCB2311586.1 amino acid adenylation domain-containing protein [Clostridium tagluense]MCB2316310.1 amino acid adenylation domain-containing protein [Clostridium tagluense]MCB2321165.1 amino acid adenylation domain-containing protein [Clostridium tagluense]MCB2326179.1 amino acid adenylation domain-containing protein [Clostridium tagluense]MCB2330902.1 amino acid adenylation domain-containing protein [Clostridium tagluense]
MGKENKLDRNNIEDVMSLTSMQQGMLFHYIKDKQSTEYHEQLSLTINGNVNRDLLQKTWDFIVENNEMLRTIFRWKGIDKPVQLVLKKHQVLIQYKDFTKELDKDKSIENIKLKDLSYRIDITKETLRIYLCKLKEDKYEIIISNHHILYDGWSNGIILKELMETYNCLFESKELTKLNKTKFSEFVKYTKSLNQVEQKKYWVNCLQNSDGKDNYFGYKEKGISKEVSYKIDIAKANIIRDFAKANKILFSSVLYGIWGVLVQKLSNSNDVLFGTTVSGRPGSIKSIDNMIGLFINTIPLRIKSEEKITFINLIHNVDTALNERKDFENTPLTDIKEYCGLGANEDLFNSIIVIENYPLDMKLNNKVLFIEKFSIIEKTNYNMTLEILNFDGLEFKFIFNSLAIDENMVNRLGRYLESLIDTLLDNKNIDVLEVNILSEEEKNQILYEFNDTQCDYMSDKTIQYFFETQVDKTPDNIAVVFEETELTYKELNEKANQLAREIRNKGVKANSIVGIMVGRSPEMLVGILAILKAGGAYLPLDPQYPTDRIAYMIQDAKVEILIVDNKYAGNAKFNNEIININDKNIFNTKKENLDIVNSFGDLAYVIYTSGSTGKPKGIMIEHKQVNNFTHSIVRETKLNLYQSILCITTMCFDMFVLETLVPLIQGLKVVIASEEERNNGDKLGKVLEKNNVEIMQSTPSRINVLLDSNGFVNAMKSLKVLLVGGEEVQLSVLEKLYVNNSIKIYNVYGPTETTVWSTAKLVNKGEKVTIGKPIGNTKVYILNNNKLSPIGVSGELYIAGDGLARGYLNNTELTVEKFVQNPFEFGTKMFKTGDLVRWMTDGNIEFLGRIDNQVKIRGFRIELGEIENRLSQHEGIKEAAVIIKESKYNDKYIGAYVVCEKEISELNLRGYLRKSLPEYMIPAYFIQLEKMPLTHTEKIDRKALPEVNFELFSNKYEAPRNGIEEKLSKIWSGILGIEKVGINDNFFELGGHSLKATTLSAFIHKRINLKVSLKDIFDNPTIKELAAFIKGVEENIYKSIELVEKKDYYSFSSAQKRMYVLQHMNLLSTSYNISLFQTIEGAIDKDEFESAIRQLILRHESLRTSFEIINYEPVQIIHEDINFSISYYETDESKVQQLIDEFIKPFELSKAPLFRIGLIKIEENKNILMFDIHHIITDGTSMDIFIREFIELYEGNILPELKLQYKDYAEWQNNKNNDLQIKNQENYWLGIFEKLPPILELPIDFIRGVNIHESEENELSFELDRKLVKLLKQTVASTGVSLYILSLAIYNVLLCKYCNEEDIVVGTAVAGRIHADLKGIMGMFVNMVAVRNYPKADKTFFDFLMEVRYSSLQTLDNQEYQFDTLVSKLNLSKNLNRNPLFDTVFQVQNVGVSSINATNLKIYPYVGRSKKNMSRYELVLSIEERENNIYCNFQYCTRLYMKETIEKLWNNYVEIMRTVLLNNYVKIKNIDIHLEEPASKGIVSELINNIEFDF